MASKKLSPADHIELQQLVMEGVPPGDLAEKFKIAVSSVHNYKKQLREQGLVLPDVRGKRPTGRYNAATQPVQGNGPVMLGTHTGSLGEGAVLPHEGEEQTGESAYVYFIVNGRKIAIDARASSIRVENGTVIVDF